MNNLRTCFRTFYQIERNSVFQSLLSSLQYSLLNVGFSNSLANVTSEHFLQSNLKERKIKNKSKVRAKTRPEFSLYTSTGRPLSNISVSLTLISLSSLSLRFSLVADILYPYVKTIWYEIHSAQHHPFVLILKVISELLKSPKLSFLFQVFAYTVLLPRTITSPSFKKGAGFDILSCTPSSCVHTARSLGTF